ncbi:MAG: acylphosphatase [Endomicrobiia bacterium]
MSEKIVSVKILVKGIVQGVGFRWFVKNIAEEENIKGYVKNNYDGSVEIVAETTNNAVLERFVERIKKEHPQALINSIEISYITPVCYKDFKIKF